MPRIIKSQDKMTFHFTHLTQHTYCDILGLKYECLIKQERKTSHIFLYLACEQIVFGVRQVQRKNWIKQPKKEWCKWDGQPMKILCMGVSQIPIEDLCIGVIHLPWKIFVLELDNCLGMNVNHWS